MLYIHLRGGAQETTDHRSAALVFSSAPLVHVLPICPSDFDECRTLLADILRSALNSSLGMSSYSGDDGTSPNDFGRNHHRYFRGMIPRKYYAQCRCRFGEPSFFDQFLKF
jgi:hypothetical protein